jgi:MYXO-CTERM domain-containing protein
VYPSEDGAGLRYYYLLFGLVVLGAVIALRDRQP